MLGPAFSSSQEIIFDDSLRGKQVTALKLVQLRLRSSLVLVADRFSTTKSQRGWSVKASALGGL